MIDPSTSLPLHRLIKEICITPFKKVCCSYRSGQPPRLPGLGLRQGREVSSKRSDSHVGDGLTQVQRVLGEAATGNCCPQHDLEGDLQLGIDRGLHAVLLHVLMVAFFKKKKCCIAVMPVVVPYPG